MRWLINFYDFSFKRTAKTAIGIHPTKAWLSQLVNFKMQSGCEEERYAIKFCFKLGKNDAMKSMECFRLLFDHLTWIEHQFLSVIRDSRKAGSLWGMMRSVGGVRKSIHQSWLAKELGLGLLCWGFKGVQMEIPSEEASILQIGSGPCTRPQLNPCFRLFDQDGHQQSFSPSQSSRPCSLWLLLIPWAQRLSLWENWEDERGCDEGHWHAHTGGLPCALLERQNKYIATGGDYFEGDLSFMCALSIKVPTRKKIGKLI